MARRSRVWAVLNSQALLVKVRRDLKKPTRGRLGEDGEDLFIFRDAEGNDTIAGFTAGSATEDQIDLAGVTALNSFADVQAAANQAGAETVIDTSGDNSITLIGINVGDLHSDDFLF